MTIEAIFRDAGSAERSINDRPAGAQGGTMEGEKGDADHIHLSREAQALLSGGNFQRLDVIRERVRRGYYLDPDITEQIIDSVAREIESATGW